MNYGLEKSVNLEDFIIFDISFKKFLDPLDNFLFILFSFKKNWINS